MKVVDVHEVRTHLSRVLERVLQGEEIVIARSGKPVARLVPIGDEPRRPGRLKGRIRSGRDFDDPLPEAIRRGFLGGSD